VSIIINILLLSRPTLCMAVQSVEREQSVPRAVTAILTSTDIGIYMNHLSLNICPNLPAHVGLKHFLQVIL